MEGDVQYISHLACVLNIGIIRAVASVISSFVARSFAIPYPHRSTDDLMPFFF